MRVIKFRVFVDGQFFGYEKLTAKGWFSMVPVLNPENGERWTPIVISVTGKTIRDQFTGLLDKNGVEIYEGDILEAEDPYGENKKRFVVEFKDGSYPIEWSCMFNGGESDMTTIAWAKQSDFAFEVIGNIHEHPELLTQSK